MAGSSHHGLLGHRQQSVATQGRVVSRPAAAKVMTATIAALCCPTAHVIQMLRLCAMLAQLSQSRNKRRAVVVRAEVDRVVVIGLAADSGTLSLMLRACMYAMFNVLCLPSALAY